MKTLSLPAGTYFIGDTSVLFPKISKPFHIEVMFQCPLGEGLYFDQEDQHYVSDTGFLGIVSLEGQDEDKDFIKKIGRIIVFENAFVVSFSEKQDPTHIFGNIFIYTLKSEQLEEELDLINRETHKLK